MTGVCQYTVLKYEHKSEQMFVNLQIINMHKRKSKAYMTRKTIFVQKDLFLYKKRHISLTW